MTEGKNRPKRRTRAAGVVKRADAAPADEATNGAAGSAAGASAIEASGMESIGATTGSGAVAADAGLADRRPADVLPADAIRARAYQLYLERGGSSGRDLDDWLAAERSLRGGDAGGPSAS